VKTKSSMKVYRNEITKVPMTHSHLAVKQPRDIVRVENIHSGILARQRLSHDGILNLHDLARHGRLLPFHSHTSRPRLRLWTEGYHR